MNKSNLCLKTYLLSSLCLLAMCSACEKSRNSNEAVALDVRIPISLTVDFQGRSDNIFLSLNVPGQSTVFEALAAAEKQGQLEFDHRGTGTIAFVNSINGVQNEKADGSNWVFFVNSSLAEQGCGAIKLSADDKVMWKFAKDYLQ